MKPNRVGLLHREDALDRPADHWSDSVDPGTRRASHRRFGRNRPRPLRLRRSTRRRRRQLPHRSSREAIFLEVFIIVSCRSTIRAGRPWQTQDQAGAGRTPHGAKRPPILRRRLPNSRIPSSRALAGGGAAIVHVQLGQDRRGRDGRPSWATDRAAARVSALVRPSDEQAQHLRSGAPSGLRGWPASRVRRRAGTTDRPACSQLATQLWPATASAPRRSRNVQRPRGDRRVTGVDQGECAVVGPSTCR